MSLIIPVLAFEGSILVLTIGVMGAIIVMAWAFWRMARQFKRFNDIYYYYKKQEQRNTQDSPLPPESS